MEEKIIYKGFWKNNKPNGKGCLYFQEDEMIDNFCGMFINGEIHGYGAMKYKNGEKIRGFFRQK